MKECRNVFHWSPYELFKPNSENQYAILILNRTISFPFHSRLLLQMWNCASVRITVDGGTDRWLEWLDENGLCNANNPELITGDMDSISTKTLEFFDNCIETQIIKTEDQNETDFTKALIELESFLCKKNIKIESVLVIGDNCGRLDQIIANINTLFKAKKIIPQIKIYNLGGESLTWLLPKGKNTIDIPKNFVKYQNYCGLLPIGGSRYVTTTGLKWNLNNELLEFGQLVSTSNTYSGQEVVTVETDGTIIWTMSLAKLLEAS